MPLHFSLCARRYAFLTSSGLQFSGRFIVLLTALSQYFCHAACILTWISGLISSAVLNIFWMSLGTSLSPCTLPVFAILSISALDANPFLRAIVSKEGFVSSRCAPERTLRTNVTANSGSIPEVAAAIMDIVPVGAIVVTVAFRVALSVSLCVLLSKLGKLPLSSANLLLAFRASSFRNLASFSASFSAKVESYGSPRFMSSSAKPMTPSPTRLFAFVVSSICGRGYLLTSITLSRKWTALWIVFLNLSQSNFPFLSIRVRLMLPRLQLSFGCNGCSPQGLVLCILPSAAVGFLRFISSMNISPGSPFFQALSTIRSRICLAFIVRVFSFVRGFMSAYSLFFCAASMNASVTDTDRLKFESLPSVDFAVMNSSMSG